MGIAPSFRQLAEQDLCIPRTLESIAKRAPAAVAISAPGRKPLTYDRLHLHIQEVQKALNAMGVGRNDRVAVVMRDGPEMAVAFVAVAASATFAPFNPSYRASEFDSYLAALGPKALVVQSGVHSPAVAVAQRRGMPIIELVPDFAAAAGIFALSGKQRPGSVSRGVAEPADTALVLPTSGTTAQPKLVPLTHANICASARSIAANLELDVQDRCLSIIPLYHIHGLIGATLSTLTAGAGIVCAPGFDQTAFFAYLENFRPSWYTAGPAIHQAILACADEHTEIIRRHPLRFIRSCSAPLPSTVMGELERVFDAPVIEAYGMTEASHEICANPLPPRPHKIGSVGVPTGCELAIMDEVGTVLPPEMTGEIVIRGPNVFDGYEGDPPATATAFCHGWFRTGDQGFRDRDGYVFIKGRLKDVINRGGAKISPREVEDVLVDHPAVARAVVFGVPHHTLGEAVAAAVVLRAHASATERDIREFAATRLADFRVPYRVLIVDEIPSGATGKLQRSKLADTFTPLLTSPFGRPSVAPRNKLEGQLAAIWEKVLGIHPIGVSDNFFELGGHSLLAVRLVAQMEQALGKELPLATLFQAPTVEQLARVLNQGGGPAPRSLIVPLQTNGSKPPFFCIGGVTDLGRHLSSDQPFYALRPHGMDGRQAPSTVEEMAAEYLKEIRALQPTGPYFLGGHSFGGLAAFEIAQQLRMQGQEVALLVLIDPTGPRRDQSPPPLKSGVATVSPGIPPLRNNVHRHWSQLQLLEPAEKLAYVLARIRTRVEQKIEEWIGRKIKNVVCTFYLGIGRRVPPSLRKFYFIEVARQAARAYVPQVYPGRAILFRAEKGSLDLQPAWGSLAARGLETHGVPGDHHDMLEEPHVQVLAEWLTACLHRTQSTAADTQL